MKIIIAPDSFKGSLSAQDFCDILEKSIRDKCGAHTVVKMPLGDGGEGTKASFMAANGSCEELFVEVDDLFLRKKKANIAISKNAAYIEVAEAVGLDKTRLNVMNASSKGVGQMILAALDKGVNKIYIGLGGSGSCDAGAGALAFLGLKFYDENGISFLPTGKDLCRVVRVGGTLDKRLEKCSFIAVADVQNPLFGKNGAAYVYAPQKGASAADVEALDKGLQQFSSVVGHSSQAAACGSGAAGGLGFFATAFLKAEIVSGIDFVLDLYGFESRAVDSDLVITGEGCVDFQTLCGKTVAGVLRRFDGRVLVLCGKKGEGAQKLPCEVVSINPPNEKPEISMKNAKQNLYNFDIKKYLYREEE